MNNVLLLTTPSVEGMPVEKYFGIITANQVAGTGLFTDITASFSDLFGGKSGAYRESMNELCKDVTERLKAKASDMGANAVVGVSIDYDSISAKSMSMFMVSIQGTAVKITLPNDVNSVITKDEISWETLNAEYYKKKILRKINKGIPLNNDEWSFVQKNTMPELIEPLYDYYVRCSNEKGEEQSTLAGNFSQKPEWATLGISNYKQYLYTLEYKDAINYVYKDDKSFRDIILKNKLFNAAKILEIAKEGNLDLAISLLSVEKSSYNDVDLKEMKSLCEFLNNLPEVGSKENLKGGLFSPGGLKFVCSCGCKNDLKNEYCEECGRNIYGISKKQKNEIDQFTELVDTLADLINRM